MRFELLLVFDSTDSPDKNHPCAGFALDTKPPCSEAVSYTHLDVYQSQTHRSPDMAVRPFKSYRSLLGIAVQQHRDNSGFYVAAGIRKRLNSALARRCV